jgi:hypothetical protein
MGLHQRNTDVGSSGTNAQGAAKSMLRQWLERCPGSGWRVSSTESMETLELCDTGTLHRCNTSSGYALQVMRRIFYFCHKVLFARIKAAHHGVDFCDHASVGAMLRVSFSLICSQCNILVPDLVTCDFCNNISRVVSIMAWNWNLCHTSTEGCKCL